MTKNVHAYYHDTKSRQLEMLGYLLQLIFSLCPRKLATYQTLATILQLTTLNKNSSKVRKTARAKF